MRTPMPVVTCPSSSPTRFSLTRLLGLSKSSLVSEWDSPVLGGVVHDVPTSMSQEVKKMWVEALASGHWQQGGPNLRNINGTFTAEGVLADLAVFYGVASWERLGDEYFLPPNAYWHLPPAVREWAECE